MIRIVGTFFLFALAVNWLASGAIILKMDFSGMASTIKAAAGVAIGTSGGGAAGQRVCNNGVCFQPNSGDRPRVPVDLEGN